MKHILPFLTLLFWVGIGYCQNATDASLYLKKDQIQLKEVESKSGNLFRKLGHHGPAVENPWIGLRIYFDKKAAIDLYSKAKPGLELNEKRWYPSKKEQQEGWGADYYKAGNTVGLGGIKLWDGENTVDLHPVSKRLARVYSVTDSSSMELISVGVPYKNTAVDIHVMVTVYSDKREAKVEAFCSSGVMVQFATGLNYFEGLKTKKTENYLASWGIHPEDVAAEKVQVGAALIFDKNQFEQHLDDGKQMLIISKPCNKIQTWITSANQREAKINSYPAFIAEVENIKTVVK